MLDKLLTSEQWKTAQQKYTDELIRRHQSGDTSFFLEIVALGKSGYGDCWQQVTDEYDLAYIRRCSIIDFDDGAYQGAICQDLYDQIVS
jgi:hypothetical protein